MGGARDGGSKKIDLSDYKGYNDTFWGENDPKVLFRYHLNILGRERPRDWAWQVSPSY